MTMPPEIEVVVVDDHPLFRQGVVASLTGTTGFRVVGEAADVRKAIETVRARQPDIVLLDVALPEGSGIDAIGPILIECPTARIIMLTVADDSDTILAAMRAGAAGYVLKGSSAAELRRALRTVCAGAHYTSPGAAQRILDELTHPRTHPGSTLTPREQTVLELLGQGFTNRQIAEQLFLSEKTVKRHMTVVLQKLGVRNRVEAALLAVKDKTASRDH
jgi:two-component system, NarL family, nitrate/nitrite response regulator NarL